MERDRREESQMTSQFWVETPPGTLEKVKSPKLNEHKEKLIETT